MLTCNKNFVDLTVWILRSWTCIKLNVMLHQSLEKVREPGNGATVQTETKPTPSHQTGLNWIKPDLTGLNCSNLNELCMSREEKLTGYWTEQKRSEVCWRRFGGVLVVACVAMDGALFLWAFVVLSLHLKDEWGRFHSASSVWILQLTIGCTFQYCTTNCPNCLYQTWAQTVPEFRPTVS